MEGREGKGREKRGKEGKGRKGKGGEQREKLTLFGNALVRGTDEKKLNLYI